MSGSRDIWRAGGPNPDKGKFKCPHCHKKFTLTEINEHIDSCPFAPPLGSTAPFPQFTEGTLHRARRGEANSLNEGEKGGQP